MRVAWKFWIRTVVWALCLATVFTFLSLVGGGGAEAIAHVPTWLGLGLALGTFPAGIAVWKDVVGGERLDLRAILPMVGAAAAVSAVFFVLAGFVGPALQGALVDVPASDVVEDSRQMSLLQLRAAIRDAGNTVDPDDELIPTTISDWFPVNALMWDFFVRLSGVLLTFLMAWIGVFAGYWTRLAPTPQLRTAQLLGLGLLLVMSTYLANENSWEWIVVQAAGPVPFAGLFSLIVPSLLLVGMGWPAALTLWRAGSS